jgi:hypothetical protein
MARTLTRPMFRKGGMARREEYMGGGIKTVRPKYMGGGMTGIMSGIVPDAGLAPRTGFQTGESFAQIQEKNRIKQEIQNKSPFLTPQQIEDRYNQYVQGLEDQTGMLMGIDEEGPGTFLEKAQTDLGTARSEEGKKAFIADLTAKEKAKEQKLIDKGVIESDKSVFKDTSEIPDRGRGETEKPKKTITQKLDDTPSDQDTIKSYMDMFQAALGEDEEDITRDKYLQLAKFGANLLAQPGGDLVGAIGKAAAPSIEGVAKISAADRAGKREINLAAIKTALAQMDPTELEKRYDFLKGKFPDKSEIEIANMLISGETGKARTQESRITTNAQSLVNLDPDKRLIVARSIERSGVGFEKFRQLPKDKKGNIKPDTKDGYYYDEDGTLYQIEEGQLGELGE